MYLLKPTLDCNLKCKYCYENPHRSKNEDYGKYDIQAVLNEITELEEGRQIVLHGGEPLTLGKESVKSILKAIFEKTGRSSIQTNAVLIDDEYIDMFEKYKTSVGVSLDGLGKLNRFRCGEKMTGKVYGDIVRMRDKGLNISVIAVMSRANAGDGEKLKSFENYLRGLSDMKITGRVNPCTGDPECSLSNERLSAVYSELAWFCYSNGLRWSPFTDIWNALSGEGNVVCTFRDCDIFHTQSAEVILGDALHTNCMRVSAKDLYLRHSAEYKTRSEVLPQIPQENNGCQGCEFWEYCKGGCPSQAIDGDWRNRTESCQMYKTVFTVAKNIQSFGGTKKKQSIPLPDKPNTPGGHSDGIEHIDGNMRHLDSDMGGK
jgi:uncharacterized protein